MADEGKVVIELVGKDSATTTFVKTFQDMQSSFQRLEASGRQSAASLTSIEKNATLAGNALGGLTSKMLGLVSLSYVGYKIGEGFQAAIKSIDTFQTQAIQIAATLISLAAPGQGSIDQQFGRNLAYAQRMYRAINAEAAHHFASAAEMMTVYNRLTQEGYQVRLDEVKALGQLTDLIKMYTGDQNLEKQLNQEIRALMQGQAKATDALAMSLKAQLGPGWEKLLAQHREAGDLLQWIAGLYPGLEAATGKITETWSAQYATLQSLLQLLSIDGLGGAYADIVNQLKLANAYLREHGDELAGRIQSAWNNIRPIVAAVASALATAADSGLQLATNLDKITQNRGLMTVFGVLAGSRFGVAGAVAGGLAGLGVAQTLSNEAEVKRGIERAIRASGEFGGYEEPELAALGYKAAMAGPSILRKPPGTALGGGGGRAAARELALTEVTLFDQATWAMEDTEKAVKSATTSLAAMLNNQERLVKGQKSYASEMAGLSPLLSDQMAFKAEALRLENDLALLTLKRELDEKKINQAIYDQEVGYRALITQAKKYNLEMESQTGFMGWAYERNKAGGRQSTIKNLMGGAENFLTSAFASGLQGVLSQEKKTLQNIGKTMFMGFVGEIHKGGITRSFDALAKIISPGKEGDAGKSLSMAGVQLNSAGVQLATSAGGLLLSGIGIMTNSQALVVAGTVLQVAGLAIQVYQSLVATTQITAAAALTGSAVALTTAAGALMAAAAVDMIPFFHSGGVITAHAGWPRLRSDEVPIIAQAGERVLSRAQNRAYEGGGGRPIVVNFSHAPTYGYRPTQREVNRDADIMVKALERKLGSKGHKLGAAR